MAIEIAFAKRAKISKAQKYMLLAVFGAAIVLGASAAIIIHCVVAKATISIFSVWFARITWML